MNEVVGFKDIMLIIEPILKPAFLTIVIVFIISSIVLALKIIFKK